MLPVNDTIAAVSTPNFPGGTGVIRISGRDALDITDKVFVGKKSLKSLQSYTAQYGYVTDPSKNVKIDEAVCLVMKAPNTYTGEDVVEISMHGSPLLLQKALEMIFENGARQAEAGEFTYRSYINGKKTLTEAEAVNQLISARSEAGLRNAFLQMKGSLQKKITGIREDILKLTADYEADIEFPDENIDAASGEKPGNNIQKSVQRIGELINTYQLGLKIEDGLKIVICGPPNSGKSTLLNRLLNENKAIIHSIPGTTRDIVEGRIIVNGAVISLVDTAGIRNFAEEVEDAGIKKTFSQIKNADLILWIQSADKYNKEPEKEFKSVFNNAKETINNVFRIVNKSDKLEKDERSKVKERLKTDNRLLISAKKGWGINDLRKIISEKLKSLDIENYEGTIITSSRQKQLLERSRSSLKRAARAVNDKLSAEYICADLYESAGYLDEIIGKEPDENIYDIIFRNFCLGK